MRYILQYTYLTKYSYWFSNLSFYQQDVIYKERELKFLSPDTYCLLLFLCTLDYTIARNTYFDSSTTKLFIVIGHYA